MTSVSQEQARTGLEFFLDLPHFRYPGEQDSDAGKSRAFRQSLRVIRFVCEEKINENYLLDLVFEVVSDVKVEHDLLLGQPLMLRAAWTHVRDVFDPGAPGKSSADYKDAGARTFTARVREVEFLGRGNTKIGDGTARALYFRVFAIPALWAMTQARRNRTFQRRTVKDMLEDVFSSYNVPKTAIPKIIRTYGEGLADDPLNAERGFAMQYEESDFDFFIRWLERQGWHYTFDFSAAEKIAPGPDGGNLMKYQEETVAIDNAPRLRKLGLGSSQYMRLAAEAGGLGVSRMVGKFSAYPRKFVIHDHDPDNPLGPLPLATAEREYGTPPVTLADEFYSSAEEGLILLDRRNKSFAAHRSVYEGEANLPGFTPGAAILLLEDAEEFAAEHGSSEGDLSAAWSAENGHARFITATRHVGVASLPKETAAAVERLLPGFSETRARVGGGGDDFLPGYRVSFSSVPFSNNYYPKRTAPWPKLTGNLSAWVLPVVTEGGNISACYEDGTYSLYIAGVQPRPVKALDPGATGYVRRVDVPVTDNAATYQSLPVGTEVSVSFGGGNPDRPVISGVVANYAFRQQTMTEGVRNVLHGGKTEFASSYTDDGNIINYLVTQLGGLPTLMTTATNSSTMASLNAYTTNISALNLDTFASVMTQSMATYKNMLASSVSPAASTPLSIVSNLLAAATKGGLTYYDSVLSEDYRDINNTDSSDPDYQKKRAEAGGHKQAKGQFAGIMGQTARLIPVVQMALMMYNLGTLSDLKSRVTMTADESTSAVITAAAPPTKLNTAFNIATLAAAMVKDALAYADAIASRVSYSRQVEDEFKSRENAKEAVDKRLDALGVDHTKFDAKADKVTESMSNLKTVIPISYGVSSLQALLQAMIYIKIIARAGRFKLGNTGVAIVSRRSPDAKKGVMGNLWSGTKSMLAPIKPSSWVKFFAGLSKNEKFDKDKGMTINISSDGNTFVAGDDHVQLYSGSNSQNPKYYDTTPASPKKATLVLHTSGSVVGPPKIVDGEVLDPERTSSSANLNAQNVFVKGSDRVSMIVPIDGKENQSAVTLNKEGDADIYGKGTLNTQFARDVTIKSDDFIFLEGKGLMSYVKEQGIVLATPGPYLSIKGDSSAGEQLKTAFAEYVQARDQHAMAEAEYESAVESQDSYVMSTVNGCAIAMSTAKDVMDAKLKAYTAKFDAVREQDSFIVSGDSQAKNTITLTPKGITTESDTEILLKLGDTGEVSMSPEGISIDAKTKKVTIKGTTKCDIF